MDAPDTRTAVGQLSSDLGWLEGYCRLQPALAEHAGQLRLASALVRNVVGPFLENQPPRPLHVAVVGGAGAGKSTVVNFLAGTVVADANPQAGFTRHPTAYLPNGPAFQWPSYLGFLGPLQKLSQDKSADLDEDVYQVRRVPPGKVATDVLSEFVIWDCPDMTTWASAGYVSRLMEVAALADLIIYVASDERYNDAVPTEFLHLLVKAGKAIVVVLTKMSEGNAPAFIEHFRQEILGRLPKLPDGNTPAVPVIAFPQMPQAERTDPSGLGAKHRANLINQILVQCENETAARNRTVANAAKYLSSAGEGLLEVARRDLAEFDAWKGVVDSGKSAFEERYRREFLSGEQFRRFDRYRDRMMDLIELPGAGRLVGGAFWALRSPYRWTRDYVARILIRPDLLNLAEQTVLSASLLGWLDMLQAEALRRAGSHPVWKGIARGFENGLALQARDRFNLEFRNFELKETDELEQAGQAMVDKLEKNPAILYTLRGGKLVTDVGVIIGSIVIAWGNSWYYLLLMPLGVSATHQIAELIVRGAAETARGRVRNQRESLVRSSLTEPLAAWLCEWPATGGTSFEKLQQVLRRVPATIHQLEEKVTAKIGISQVATPSAATGIATETQNDPPNA